MSNYKIRVNSKSESKEAQQLFFELGYEKGACSTGGYPALIIATPESRFKKTPYSSRATSLNHEAHNQYKEITITELRDMVNPMKEYLFKYNDQYTLVELSKKDAESNPEQYIEIPEGSNIAVIEDSKVRFYSKYTSADLDHLGKDLIWMRHTQPEELPFIDDEPSQSLNNQYAEIEKVRQSAWQKQEGGNHYKNLKIQPMQYALENKLDYAQANVVKYVTRHKEKNGKEDLLKAIHNIELMIEFYYGDEK